MSLEDVVTLNPAYAGETTNLKLPTRYFVI
jgi:hypothetical protein